MIRIGLKTPLDAVPEIAGVGFDCLELPLRDVAALSEGEFAELTEYLAYLNVRVGAVSDLIPDGLRVNGPAVSAQAQQQSAEEGEQLELDLGDTGDVPDKEAPLSPDAPDYRPVEEDDDGNLIFEDGAPQDSTGGPEEGA